MQEFEDSPNSGKGTRSFGVYTAFAIALSLVAICGAFWLSIAAIDEQSRITGFIGLAALFLVLGVGALVFRFKGKGRHSSIAADIPEDAPSAENSLAALDEARELFSGSLKLADTFRLTSNRIKDVMPFRAIVLYVFNDARTQLIAVHADGLNVKDVDDGLANQSLSSGSVEIDSYLEMDANQAFGSSVAIPLRTDGTVFAALQLYFCDEYDAASADKYLFKTVGERVAPLILSSLAYERTHAKALTDITTELPNERAFYLMLEKQIAESQQDRGGEPLTVLAIDINDFEQINVKHGHSTGDRVLNFVAQVTRDTLRRMDFLARSVNDEFLAILPTASKDTSQMIIARIQNAFEERQFQLSDDESMVIELNIGWATYCDDGSTPSELLSFAELKKEQQKIPLGDNVVAFPQEFVS